MVHIISKYSLIEVFAGSGLGFMFHLEEIWLLTEKWLLEKELEMSSKSDHGLGSTCEEASLKLSGTGF